MSSTRLRGFRVGVDAVEIGAASGMAMEAGVSEAFYDVPEFMREETLPPRNSVYDIPMEEMQRIWKVEIPKDVF